MCGRNEIEEIFKGYKKCTVSSNINIVDLLINMNIASSKREAREFVSSNAISINGEKISDLLYNISEDDFLHGRYIIVRRGKKNYYLGEKE